GVILAVLGEPAEQRTADVGLTFAGAAELELDAAFVSKFVIGGPLELLLRRRARPLRNEADGLRVEQRGLVIGGLGLGIAAARLGNTPVRCFDRRVIARGIHAVRRRGLHLRQQGAAAGGKFF